MSSPLARVILALFGGYFIILLFLSVYDWIEEEYPRRPTKPPSSERIHYPFYHQEVANALKRFYRLPESEKAVIKKKLGIEFDFHGTMADPSWPVRLSDNMHGRAS